MKRPAHRVIFSVHKIFKKIFKNILTKDEFIFEKLYNAVSAPMTTTRDALAERLQNLHETAYLLYKRNMEYGRQRLKDIIEKEAEEEQQQEKRVPAAAK